MTNISHVSMLELIMLATIAGGCFWCTEAIFSQVIPFDKLLYVFFKLHDPTTLNAQGADVGTQYRSAIFYHSPAQRTSALEAIKKAQSEYKDKIVTEVTEFNNFYAADPSHKDYYFKHRSNPYCMLVIDPKINKLKKDFKEMLKS